VRFAFARSLSALGLDPVGLIDPRCSVPLRCTPHWPSMDAEAAAGAGFVGLLPPPPWPSVDAEAREREGDLALEQEQEQEVAGGC
jgi:hypothetical protein